MMVAIMKITNYFDHGGSCLDLCTFQISLNVILKIGARETR